MGKFWGDRRLNQSEGCMKKLHSTSKPSTTTTKRLICGDSRSHGIFSLKIMWNMGNLREQRVKVGFAKASDPI